MYFSSRCSCDREYRVRLGGVGVGGFQKFREEYFEKKGASCSLLRWPRSELKVKYLAE